MLGYFVRQQGIRQLGTRRKLQRVGFTSESVVSLGRHLDLQSQRGRQPVLAGVLNPRVPIRCLKRSFSEKPPLDLSSSPPFDHSIKRDEKMLFQTSKMLDLSWRPPPPCKVGDPLTAIDTPAMIVDLDAADYNMKKMSSIMEQWPQVAVRAHVKAHKTPALAKLQVEAGAMGVCCQTLVECEAMVHGAAISDILLTNQLIGKKKLRRFAALARHATTALCVDNIDNINDISEVAMECNAIIGILVEVDVGQSRCGVKPGEPAAILAEHISKLRNVFFKGIHCYQGANQHNRTAEGRKKEVESVVEKVKESLKALEDRNIPCNVVTGGGTGSFRYEADSGVYTEVQPGSYIVMDGDYAKNIGEDGQSFRDFKHSLYILSTIQSVTSGSRAVCDAGLKGLSVDSGAPTVHERPEMQYIIGGDEHGMIVPEGDLKVGDQIQLVPGHCDPTCNMHDWMVGVRDGIVEAVWPVMGRGPGV